MKKLNRFLSYKGLVFGDYILFQEYQPLLIDESKYIVSKPILCIYLGHFIADQTAGFNYVRWNNDKRIEYITNEYVTNFAVCKEVERIDLHIEWQDFIDILGVWKNKPSWKEILIAYRKQYPDNTINKDCIEW